MAVARVLEAVAETAMATLELVNAIRDQMASAKHRMRQDLPKLYSQDMLNNDYFSHTNLQNQSPSARAIAAGYSTGAGENIAWSGSTGSGGQRKSGNV